MKTDRIRTICRSGLTAVFLAGAAVLIAPPSATAAKITVSNCQSTKVRICSFDDKNYNTVKGNTGSHNLAQNEQGKFSCHANCYFKIVDCDAHAGCDDCKKNGYWLNHSYGKGTYNLNGLTTQEHQAEPTAYVSSNFEKTESTVICE